MRVALVASLLLAGCAGHPDLTILAPADGTTITTRDPIVIEYRVDNWESGAQLEFRVDGTVVDPSSAPQLGTYHSAGCPPSGSSSLTWTPFSTFANGSHMVTVFCMYDLSGPEESITLVFQRPAP